MVDSFNSPIGRNYRKKLQSRAGQKTEHFSPAAELSSSQRNQNRERKKLAAGNDKTKPNGAGIVEPPRGKSAFGRDKSSALTPQKQASQSRWKIFSTRKKNPTQAAQGNKKLAKSQAQKQKAAEIKNPIITPELSIPRTRGKSSRFSAQNNPVIKSRVQIPNKPVAKPGKKEQHLPRGAKVIPAQVQQKLAADRRKHKRKRAYQLLALLCLMLVSAWGLLYSPLLALQMEKVKIEGANQYYPLKQAQEVVKNWEGYSLLLLRQESLKTAFAQTNPWVKEIELHRDFPHGLTVKLILRQAVVRSGEGFLDANGVALPKAGENLEQLPLYGSKCDKETESTCTKNALEILAVLPEDLRAQVTQLNAHSRKNIVLTLNSGTEIVWGDSSNNQKKLKVLQVLLQRPAQVYNITDYGHPLVK